MNLKFLGTGSAFTLNNYQTNAILNHNYKNLLIDCGTDIRFSLRDSKMSYKDIDAVYISHLHADHCGGLEYLGFCTYFDSSCNRPLLYIDESLVDQLWNTLKAGMGILDSKVASINDYFQVESIPSSNVFTWNSIQFNTVQANHVVNAFTTMYTYGLRWTTLIGNNILFTSDCNCMPEFPLMEQYKNADIIFHDCSTLYVSDVHTHFDDLKKLPDDIKHKMHLCHYHDNVVDDFKKFNDNAINEGFSGFVVEGETINI